MAKQAISTTIQAEHLQFLDSLASHRQQPRSEVLDELIGKYQREWLRKELTDAVAHQDEEDTSLAEMGMGDYSDIIARDEK